MKKFVIQWRKYESKRSYIYEVMNFLILEFSGFYFDFSGFIPLKNSKKGLFNRTEVTWHDTDMWRGHASPRGAYVA